MKFTALLWLIAIPIAASAQQRPIRGISNDFDLVLNRVLSERQIGFHHYEGVLVSRSGDNSSRESIRMPGFQFCRIEEGLIMDSDGTGSYDKEFTCLQSFASFDGMSTFYSDVVRKVDNYFRTLAPEDHYVSWPGAGGALLPDLQVRCFGTGRGAPSVVVEGGRNPAATDGSYMVSLSVVDDDHTRRNLPITCRT